MSNRQRLSNRRQAETFTFQHSWGQLKYHVTTGRQEPLGRVLEVFINVGKTGDNLEALMKDAGTLISHALQRGATLEELQHSVMRDMSGEPSSPVGKLLDLLGDA